MMAAQLSGEITLYTGVLQHVDAIADAHAQRASAAAFADHDDDHRHAQARHFAQVVGDGFGLAALFGVDAGIGAQAYRASEMMGRENLAASSISAHRLAVAFGLGHAQVAEQLSAWCRGPFAGRSP